MRADLYLVDASIYVFRGYFSLPSSMTDAGGEVNQAVRGYAQFMADLLAHAPQRLSVAFDESLNTCFRNDLYPDYKANRELPDANLEWQFAECRRLTELLGIHMLNEKHFEADDLIGTVAVRYGDGGRTVIVTRDKDLGQLLRPGDTLWDFAADTHMDPSAVREKFGVECSQIADFLALAGDSVDNIPGVTGIGAKTAAALLNEFGSLAELLDNLDRVPATGIRGAARIAARLADEADQVRLYRQLTEIKCDVPVTMSEAELTPGPVKVQALQAFLAQHHLTARVSEALLSREE